MRGRLIVIEGLDGSGKTTLAKKLVELLQEDEINVRYVHFPLENTLTYPLVDSFLSELVDLPPKSAHLLFAANFYEGMERIVKGLQEGVTYVVDRYFYSGIVYACGADGLHQHWIQQVYAESILPDLILFLNVPAHVRQQRIQRAQRFDDDLIQQRVLNEYINLMENDWALINGALPLSEVVELCLEQMRTIFQLVKN